MRKQNKRKYNIYQKKIKIKNRNYKVFIYIVKKKIK